MSFGDDEKSLQEARISSEPGNMVRLDEVPRTSSGLPRKSVQFARRASEPGRERITSDPGPSDEERRTTFDFGRRRSSDLGRRRSSDHGRRSFVAPRTSLAGPARVRTDLANALVPPPLDYDLRSRKRSIAIFWTLILIDSIVMPLGLYFGLWYGTNLTPNTVFSIVTAALGGASIFEYVVRFWRLWKKGSTCRVIGGRRAYLDWFHWNFSLSWVIIMVELIMYVEPPSTPSSHLANPNTEAPYPTTLQFVCLPCPSPRSFMSLVLRC